MKMRLDCLPCLFRQTLESARMVTDDEEIQSYIKEISGINDPYAELKKKNLEAAHKLLPLVEEEIEAAEDSLLAAFLMSAMGNSIDAGVSLNVNIKENIESALENSFVRSDYQQFLEELKNAEELLFIADNTGEAVFDKLLLEKLQAYDLKITYAVRETAVLNDITYQGVVELGIDQYAEIIKSGSRAPGMIMDAASQEFLKHYKKADLVISKGQGNLESLYNIESNIYFLLKAKCDVIAEVLNVEEGDFVLMYS